MRRENATIFIEVEPNAAGYYFGKGGENIRKIEDETKVKVVYHDTTSRFKMTGTTAEANKAHELIKDIKRKHEKRAKNIKNKNATETECRHYKREESANTGTLVFIGTN